jgi:hypothetical protein
LPVTLSTVLNKITTDVQNKANQKLLQEFYQYMKNNGTSGNYQIGNLKAMIHEVTLLQMKHLAYVKGMPRGISLAMAR